MRFLEDKLWDENLIIINKINFYQEFEDWYWKINKDFNFDFKLDQKARDILLSIFNDKDPEWNLESVLKSFCKRIKSKKSIFIYGCGPTLVKTVNYIINAKIKERFINSIHLAADGATIFLKEIEVPVDATFTDLDGIRTEDFNYPNYIIVHAHGDNIDKLLNYKNEIIKAKKIIGTTQVKPHEKILNPGGFTDGDRILFFIRSLIRSDQNIYLIGMDFKDVIGKYSKPDYEENVRGTPTKIKKLEYAYKLTSWFAEMIENKVFLLNSNLKIKNIESVSLEEITDLNF